MRQAREAWIDEAQERLDDVLDHEGRDRIREEIAERLADMESEVEALRDELRVDVDAWELDLPEIIVPEPEMNGRMPGAPLIDSEWEWGEQTLALKKRKAYEL